MLPLGHTSDVLRARFSPDGKKVLTVSSDGTAKVWEANSGRLLRDFNTGGEGLQSYVEAAEFTPDGNRVIIRYGYGGKGSKMVDLRTGMELDDWKSDFFLNKFTADGMKVVTGDTIFNSTTLKPLAVIKGGQIENCSWIFSPDGKKLVTVSITEDGADSDSLAAIAYRTNLPYANSLRIWDPLTGKALTPYKKQNDRIHSIQFSPDGKKILVLMDTSAALLDPITLAVFARLRNYRSARSFESGMPEELKYSPDGKKIIQLCNLRFRDGENREYLGGNQYYDSATVWDAMTGKILYGFKRLLQPGALNYFSPDSKRLLLLDTGIVVRVRDAMTGKEILSLTGQDDRMTAADFSFDNKSILTGSSTGNICIWDAVTGKMTDSIDAHSKPINEVHYSPDGTKIVSASNDQTAKTWDVASQTELGLMKGRTLSLKSAVFTKDGKRIIIATAKNKLRWDPEKARLDLISVMTDSIQNTYQTADGKVYSNDSVYLAQTQGDSIKLIRKDGTYELWSHEPDLIRYVQFSPDNRKLLITTKRNTIKLIRIADRKLLFTFLAINNSDFLVTDADNHYDGTDNARRLLHFICGDEVVGLEQVKDQLWVPDLGDHIMKGDVIKSATLADLNICGLTPLVQDKSTPTEYRFTISPRRGGLGETVLLVNDIEVRRFTPEQLKNKTGAFEVVIKKNELDSFLKGEEKNTVEVKSYTTDNKVLSRGGKMEVSKTVKKMSTPNLYAVIIGVSQYKGKDIQLKFAAKDASDFSRALSISARKLLNNDSAEHVFTYDLTTSPGYYRLPEKKAIKAILDSVGKKANANDILLIFFAGHGLAAGTDKKQFYFLAQDAESLTDTAAFKNVGISTAELMDWTKPQSIKAQKRILIFDACSSGQIINDFVKAGNADLLFTARGGGDAQQVKVLDKLNERSGFVIFSASTSDQSAYELTSLSQGLLTYSLLKVIKQDPDVLEDNKFLNIQKWFSAAGETVTETIAQMTSNEKRQEPQIISSANFAIGVVDKDVTSSITLPQEKPVFGGTSFQNSDEDIASDDLELSKVVNAQLSKRASRDTNNVLVFVANTNASDAFIVGGRYDVKGDGIVVRVNIRQGKEIKYRYEVSGKKNAMEQMAVEIVSRAAEWIAAKK